MSKIAPNSDRANSILQISMANSSCFSAIANVMKMPANGLTIGESFEVARQVTKVLRATDSLGRFLGQLEDRPSEY